MSLKVSLSCELSDLLSSGDIFIFLVKVYYVQQLCCIIGFANFN